MLMDDKIILKHPRPNISESEYFLTHAAIKKIDGGFNFTKHNTTPSNTYYYWEKDIDEISENEIIEWFRSIHHEL